MKYIIINISTGKQVPALDVCGEEHWEALDLRTAAKVVTAMNREVGEKVYRMEAL